MKNFYYINKKTLTIESTEKETDSKNLDFFKTLSKMTINTHKHPYHLVNPSPWPFIISFGCFFLLLEMLCFFMVILEVSF